MNYDSNADGEHIFDKRRACDEMWRALSVEAKAPYITAAMEDNERASLFKDEGFPEFLRRHAHLHTTMKNKTSQYLSERLRAVQKTVKDMVGHEVFQAGSQLHSFDTGVRSEHVRIDLSRAEITAKGKDAFGYDARKEHNPSSMPFFLPCAQKNGGLCCKDALLQHARVMTTNVYVKTRPFKEKLPVFVEFGTHGSTLRMHAFMGRLIGEGKLAMFTKTVFVPKSDETELDAAELEFQEYGTELEPTSFPAPSHTCFSSLLCIFARDIGVDPVTIESMTMKMWTFKRDLSVNYFRVLLVEAKHCYDLSFVVAESTRKRKTTDTPEDDDVLPFGLSFASSSISESTPAAKKSKKGPKDDCRDTDDESEGGYGPPSDESEHDYDRSVCDSSSADDVDADGDHMDKPVSDDEDVPIPPAAEVEVEAEPEPEPWNAVGMKEWDVAPTGLAMCFVCKKKMMKGELRLSYRFKQTKARGDQKRCRHSCAEGIPKATRPRELNVIRRWLLADALSLEHRALLDQSLAALLIE